jgi:hypothetical protein
VGNGADSGTVIQLKKGTVMAFAFFGFQLLMLMGSATGNWSSDLVSFIHAEGYFQARSVDVKVANLVELAGKQATDGKGQISQLLAIRWLGEHGDEAKKDPKARELLQALAAGSKAQDPQGFAKEYAARALAHIDSKPVPFAVLPDDSIRIDSLKWFPASASLHGAMDFRSPKGFKPVDLKTPAHIIHSVMPAQAREEMYKFAEDVGNVHLDRASFAYSPDPNQKDNSRIYMRLTGRGDRKRLTEFIKKNLQKHTVKDEVTPQGETITVFSSEKEAPNFAIVGDTDLIVAGYEGNQAKHVEVVQEMLEVRAGKKPSLVAGPPSGDLKDVPANASGMLIGELPEEIRKGMTNGTPFRAFPNTVAMDLTKGTDLVFRFRGSLSSALDAKSFCESVAQLKQMAVEGLKKPPPNLKLKPKTLQLLIKTVEDIKAEAKDTTVTSTVTISRAVLEAVNELIEEGIKAFGPIP